jgi:hypothetical protein
MGNISSCCDYCRMFPHFPYYYLSPFPFSSQQAQVAVVRAPVARERAGGGCRPAPVPRKYVEQLSRFSLPLNPAFIDRTTTNFFAGSPLAALTTLSFSDNVDLQRSAALAFAEITEKEVRPVGRDTLDPILFLLSSHDTEVQRAASAALGNLAVNSKLPPSRFYVVNYRLTLPLADNKLLIVKLGGLEPLIRQMLSPNVEVQCNAVGCITNLATHGMRNPTVTLFISVLKSG